MLRQVAEHRNCEAVAYLASPIASSAGKPIRFANGLDHLVEILASQIDCICIVGGLRISHAVERGQSLPQ